MPTVRTIFHPPTQVPRVSDTVARAVTQSGALVPVECCVATSITTITPVALAASFAPWPNASSAELTHWLHRIGRSISWVARRNEKRETRLPTNPVTNPNAGEITNAKKMRPTVLHPTEPVPSATIVAPTSPPTNAWVELDGSPRHHEKVFHTSAPVTPAPTTATTWSAGTSMTFPTVSATA